MKKEQALSTDQAPAAIGPYSQGAQAGPFVFTAGQVPVDPGTKEMPADLPGSSCPGSPAIAQSSGQRPASR